MRRAAGFRCSYGIAFLTARRTRVFLEVLDDGVARVAEGGLGAPDSFFYWHWAMVPFFFLTFLLFASTTDSANPWGDLLKKLAIYLNIYESFGLGASHGPLHGKMSPPFQDWWYRLTPGTLKYNAPFMPSWLPIQRTYLDIVVEGLLTYIFSFRALMAPTVTTSMMIPIALCGIYEFFFDYGQHIHTYATQNLHVFVCCCFDKGQLAGIQLFFCLLYFSSGICKLGPTFQYMFTSNLLSSFFMVDTPLGRKFPEHLL